MRDQRVENLAKILVRYSTKVEKGESVVIGGASSAEPLLLAIYEETLRAGANPIVQMAPEAGSMRACASTNAALPRPSVASSLRASATSAKT